MTEPRTIATPLEAALTVAVITSNVNPAQNRGCASKYGPPLRTYDHGLEGCFQAFTYRGGFFLVGRGGHLAYFAYTPYFAYTHMIRYIPMLLRALHNSVTEENVYEVNPQSGQSTSINKSEHLTIGCQMLVYSTYFRTNVEKLLNSATR